MLVIGGGITGAGVALDAAARGYRVGLIDQSDFAGGTSSRSTKLVHGGLRYLAQQQVGLVRDALRERALLLRLAPHLVQAQPFLVPMYAGMTRPLGMRVPAVFRPFTPLGVHLALWGYDRLARARTFRHLRLSARQAVDRISDLRHDGLRGAFMYYDARTDDVRLTLAVLATARRFGAAAVNYMRAHALIKDARRVAGVMAEDRITDRRFDIRARHVVNAAGVWAERVAELDAPPPFRIRPSKGVHLVLRADRLGSDTALVIPETDDGRLAFLVPWCGRVILGTTDDAYAGPLETPSADAHDVAYLLRHANRYLSRRIDPADVLGVYAGLRPLLAARDARSADLAREHAVVTSSSGLVSIVGGKLTSYRQMAEDTIDVLTARDGGGRPCRTATIPLADADGLAALAASDHALLRPLVADLPVTAAEVVYACREEMALTLVDMMFVRTRLSILCEDAGASAVQRVGDLMSGELGWDAAERRRQREVWEAAVDRERAALHALLLER